MDEINIDKHMCRVLEVFLQNPAKSFDYIDLRKLLKESETQIRDPLRELERAKILEVSRDRGRPHSGIRVKKYRISDDLEAFSKLSAMYRTKGLNYFIKSKYINVIKEKFKPILIEEASRFGFKSVKDFIELDIHLSPITSIQSNFPPKLLISQPFTRIFSDAYILNEDDIKKFIDRAYIFYSNFAEIFATAIQYTITERHDNRNHLSDIDSLVKQAIFYWNISAHSFDWAYSCLIDALKSGDEINFYIDFVDGVIEIHKLKSYPGSIALYLSEDTVVSNYFLSEPIPLDSLRPCIPFRKNGVAVEPIRYEQIISDVKSYFK